MDTERLAELGRTLVQMHAKRERWVIDPLMFVFRRDPNKRQGKIAKLSLEPDDLMRKRALMMIRVLRSTGMLDGVLVIAESTIHEEGIEGADDKKGVTRADMARICEGAGRPAVLVHARGDDGGSRLIVLNVATDKNGKRFVYENAEMSRNPGKLVTPFDPAYVDAEDILGTGGAR